MRRVFLSYRRDDSQFITSFIHRELEDPAAFGPDSVFMDIDNIPPGVDFRDVIHKAVSQCEFFLAVIGKQWVTPRLMKPNDFVRLEIEAALQRDIPVTLVLVDGATMPAAAELPVSLHPLLFKNARTLRHGKDFTPDVLRLVTGLHEAAKWYATPISGERRDESLPVVTPAALQPEGLSPPAQASGLGPQSLTGPGETLSGLKPPPPDSPGRSPGLMETALRAEDKPLVKLIVPAEPKLELPPPVVPVRKAGERHQITLPGQVPMTFAWCPPGTFRMGSPASEKDRGSDEQLHEVTLSKGFWMGIHPVTQARWRAVMGTDPSHFKGDTLPVEQASWKDAVTFCATLKQKPEGKGIALRLPTEAEWEYACRAGTTTTFYWGDTLNGSQANCDGRTPYGTVTKGTYLQKTTPVGNYADKALKKHPWGLCDMHGNVWEWCSDWYDAGFYGQPEAAKDPERKDCEHKYRVVRGGSWESGDWSCRAAVRCRLQPSYRGKHFGFRLCLD